MENIYKTDGLSTEQIGSLEDLTRSYSSLESRSATGANGQIDQFNTAIRDGLLELGVDMSDPRIHFAVVAGASIMSDYVNRAHDSGNQVNAASGLIMGAVVSARPVQEIQ